MPAIEPMLALARETVPAPGVLPGGPAFEAKLWTGFGLVPLSTAERASWQFWQPGLYGTRRPGAVQLGTVIPDAVFHAPSHPEPLRGPEGYMEVIGTMRSGFPDLQWTWRRWSRKATRWPHGHHARHSRR
jgi:hypothetical protein